MADTRAFKGFSNDQMKRIGNIMGYTGPVSGFKDYLKSNPALEARYAGLENKARLKMAVGGTPQTPMATPEGTEVLSPAQQNEMMQARVPKNNAMQTQEVAVPGTATNTLSTDTQIAPSPADVEMMKQQAEQLVAQQTQMPPDPVQQMYQQYSTGLQAEQQRLDNEAPSYVADAKRQAEEYSAQVSAKYNARGKELNDAIEAKFRDRVTADMTPAERDALMQEVQSDPDYLALSQLQQEVQNDPLTKLALDNSKIYQDYMNQGIQTWQQANPAPQIGDALTARAVAPGAPEGGTLVANRVQQEPGQFIEKGTGEVDATGLAATGATADVATAGDLERFDVATVDTTKAQAGVQQVIDQNQAVQGQVSQEAQVDAQTVDPTRTAVGTISAAQIEKATQVQKPTSRTLQEGELVQSTFNAREAAAFAEEIEAAQANPSARATVQGQLDNLMADFDEGATPAWAAGALRNATAQMAARGLSSSSMAGQAMIQAAMESALPIAMTDAATYKDFEMQNLSNRQSRAMLAAEQRANFIGREFDMEFQAQVMNAAKISDIANANFTAEQQVALENARLAQTANLANLSNRQAVVMAEAAQISNLELTNLNNRQQAAVQNAQAFLQMDLTNLSNEQQTQLFNTQAVVQSIMSDTAAENASKQFNASSENQVNQYFSSMDATLSQFNAAQTNTISQFNADQTNVIEKFNTEMQNLREQFNAQNQLLIEQSDAQWRREIATLDTAALNTANQFNATAILDISNTAYANLWQQYRDTMEWAWTSTENERDRDNAIARMQMQVDYSKWAAENKEDADNSAAWGDFVFDMVKSWL